MRVNDVQEFEKTSGNFSRNCAGLADQGLYYRGYGITASSDRDPGVVAGSSADSENLAPTST